MSDEPIGDHGLMQAEIARLIAEVNKYKAALEEIKSVLNERDNIPLLMRVREIVNTALINEQKP